MARQGLLLVSEAWMCLLNVKVQSAHQQRLEVNAWSASGRVCGRDLGTGQLCSPVCPGPCFHLQSQHPLQLVPSVSPSVSLKSVPVVP